MKSKKGFTLVELLAVIAILAILVVLALPNVINMFNQARKETFVTEAKKVFSEAGKKFVSSSINGKPVKVINSEDDSKLNMTGKKLQYCIILDNKGNVTSMKVSNGEWIATLEGDQKVEDLKIEDLEEGNLNDYECGGKKPKSFKDDDWEIILDAVRNGKDRNYKVGDTKEIDLGSYGKHVIRIANKSTPSECSTSGFSQTACGFVLEFTDIISIKSMYSSSSNKNGYPASLIHTYLSNEIYNAMPADMKDGIIDTTVVSGRGYADSANFTNTGKLYLLAPGEVYTGWNYSYDTASSLTRQLDYYKELGVTDDNSSGAIKKYGNTNNDWWFRTAYSNNNQSYFFVLPTGGWGNAGIANDTSGVSPAFRIG